MIELNFIFIPLYQLGSVKNRRFSDSRPTLFLYSSSRKLLKSLLVHLNIKGGSSMLF